MKTKSCFCRGQKSLVQVVNGRFQEGALEHGEEPYAGTQREIEEETQLNPTDFRPFHVKSYIEGNNFVVIIGYICRVAASNVILNWEHDTYQWLSKDEALLLDLTADGRSFVEKFF